MPTYQKQTDIVYSVTLFCNDQEQVESIEKQLEALQGVIYVEMAQQGKEFLAEIQKQMAREDNGQDHSEEPTFHKLLNVICKSQEHSDLILGLAKANSIRTVITNTNIRICYFR